MTLAPPPPLPPTDRRPAPSRRHRIASQSAYPLHSTSLDLVVTVTPLAARVAADRRSTVAAELELEKGRAANAGQRMEDARRERRLSQEGLETFARHSQVGIPS